MDSHCAKAMLTLLCSLSAEKVELYRIRTFGGHGIAIHLRVTQTSKTIGDFVAPGVAHTYFIDAPSSSIVLEV
jgi:hypothetical protein